MNQKNKTQEQGMMDLPEISASTNNRYRLVLVFCQIFLNWKLSNTQSFTLKEKENLANSDSERMVRKLPVSD